MGIWDSIRIGASMIVDEAKYTGDYIRNKSRYELEGINDEIEEVYQNTKKLVKTTKSSFVKAVNKVNDQRKQVADTTLKDFANTFSMLKNVEFDDIKIEAQNKIDYSFEDFKLETVEHQVGLVEIVQELLPPMKLSIGAFVFNELKLSDEIEEAENNLADLKVACSKVKRKCTAIKSTTRYLKSTYDAVDALQKFADKFNELLAFIISEKGTDFRKYDKETVHQIRSIYNINMALNYFVTHSVLTKAGGIKKDYENKIKGISKDSAVTEALLMENDFYLKR